MCAATGVFHSSSWRITHDRRFIRSDTAPRRRLNRLAERRLVRPLSIEFLEDRTLLTVAATLDISNTAGALPKGLLTYTGVANFTNNLTVKTATQILDPVDGYTQLNYTFTEKVGTITLGPAPSPTAGPGAARAPSPVLDRSRS